MGTTNDGANVGSLGGGCGHHPKAEFGKLIPFPKRQNQRNAGNKEVKVPAPSGSSGKTPSPRPSTPTVPLRKPPVATTTIATPTAATAIGARENRATKDCRVRSRLALVGPSDTPRLYEVENRRPPILAPAARAPGRDGQAREPRVYVNGRSGAGGRSDGCVPGDLRGAGGGTSNGLATALVLGAYLLVVVAIAQGLAGVLSWGGSLVVVGILHLVLAAVALGRVRSPSPQDGLRPRADGTSIPLPFTR